MHPELMQMINAQRNGEMQEQAAAWRRGHEARTLPKRLARIPFAAIGGLVRNIRSLPSACGVRGRDNQMVPRSL